MELCSMIEVLGWMRRKWPLVVLICCSLLLFSSAALRSEQAYLDHYRSRLKGMMSEQRALLAMLNDPDLDTLDQAAFRDRMRKARVAMKGADLWLRYLEPNAHKLINGPLPVEWETEVFEKYEAPYRRIGAGLSLAEGLAEEPGAQLDSLKQLVEMALGATSACLEDSTMSALNDPAHLLFANRLFLLNLATIYTTGFECPDTTRVIPELLEMMQAVEATYASYAQGFPQEAMTLPYRERFHEAVEFVSRQPKAFSAFDHFRFIKYHVDPLFSINQAMIRDRGVRSRSYMDHSLSDQATSIFGKDLYVGQFTKGIFRRVEDPRTLESIRILGGQLFFDPLLSGNGQRSCASCHRPDQCFTDTTVATALGFDHRGRLGRNAPSLLNVPFNHLLMQDGSHIDLLAQARGVVTSPLEMAGDPDAVLQRVLDCPDYAKGFRALLPLTPQYEKVTMDHVLSALTIYYGDFSTYTSLFDRAMHDDAPLDAGVQEGFNLFMSRAQCATCHFAPHFNGVKPPYIGSEFEVLGVPRDTAYKALDDDLGRYLVNPAPETHRAFRTGGLRNVSRTAPYMHNGVFATMVEVISFYDGGGGAGRGLDVPNQTLSSDSLRLSPRDKQVLIAFMESLNEDLPAVPLPDHLPRSRDKAYQGRVISGVY